MDELRVKPVEQPDWEPGFIVSHQKLEIEVDFVTRSITGYTEITILPQRRDIKELRFHAHQCEIHESGVKVNGRTAECDYDDLYERINIPKQYEFGVQQYNVQKERISSLVNAGSKVRPGEVVITIPKGVRIEEVNPLSDAAPLPVRDRAVAAIRASSVTITTPTLTPRTTEDHGLRYAPLTVKIPFTNRKYREGLFWVGLGDNDTRFPHVYTRHSEYRSVASCIFPCFDTPHMRCTWEVVLKCGRTLGDALRRPQKNGSNKKDHERSNHERSKENGVKPVSETSEFVTEVTTEDSLREMNAVCSGELVHETQDPKDTTKKIFTFACEAQVGPQHIGFSIGPYEQIDLTEFREDEGNDKLGQKAVKVYGYCLPGRTDELRNTCETMAFAVDWFSLNFGAYPFQDYKLCFVDDQLPDTVPLAAFTLCTTRMLFPEDIIDPEVEVTRKLIHALASQWIGVNVLASQRTDIWVVVGVSYFITDLCMAKLCGNNDYRFRQKANSDKLVELDFSRPSISALGEVMHLDDSEREFLILKAPLVLFILDRRLTKLSGSTGISRVISRLLYNASTGELSDKTVTTEGFKRLCEKIGHYKLDAFFSQWITGAGCPRFQVTQKFNKKKLAVEMTISQKQETVPIKQKIKKEHLLRDFKEEINDVWAGDTQAVFTGPMTIRIHESDGTPYEHIVEIREGVQKIEIPYHTKYKRLKRSRREKERQAINAGTEITPDNQDDVLLYCLGDVLQSKDDMREFGLVEWDAEMEMKMEQESYEWIRMDADFEWICEMSLNMPSYMYLSQLQQDRDVVAQQDSMLFLGKQPPHPLVSTILVRTLYDKRYFWGIREMACNYLADHAIAKYDWIGQKHLAKCFQRMYCYPGSSMPRSNDFSSKLEYLMKLAIPKAMAKVRNTEGKCPQAARQFLLDLLKFNDNGNNEYSDYFYICTLMEALANSLVPVKVERNHLNFEFAEEEDEDELAAFTKNALEEIERYRRMDEWILSYQNIYTRTAMKCKTALMKGKVIPHNPGELFSYAREGTMDLVRIEAFKGMAELGFLSNDAVLNYYCNAMSTTPSPYVRRQLFETLFEALGAVAFGESSTAIDEPMAMEIDGVVEDEGEGNDLIIEDVNLGAKKELIARTTSVEGAIKYLKEQMGTNESFKTAIWSSVNSKVINAPEQCDYLDVCGIFYDAKESFIVKLPIPRYWEAKHLGKGLLRFRQTEKLRDKPLAKKVVLKPKEPEKVKPAARPPLILSMPTPRPSLSMGPPGSATPRPSLSMGPPGSATPTPVSRTPSIKLDLGAAAAASTPTTMKPPKRPLPPGGELQPSRHTKMVILRVHPSKLRLYPRGESRGSRSPLPGSKPRPQVPGRAASTPTFKKSATPSFAPPQPSRNSTPGASTPSSGMKIRMPLPGGRTPLPGSTAATNSSSVQNNSNNWAGRAASASASVVSSSAASGDRKPSLKIKFNVKAKSATPSTPTPGERRH